MLRTISCATCLHFHDDDNRETATCDAFPDGIPEQILTGEVDHKSPFPNDNGIRYERQKLLGAFVEA
jgi:hypothetical protein